MKKYSWVVLLTMTFVLTACRNQGITEETNTFMDNTPTSEMNPSQNTDSQSDMETVITQEGPYGSISVILPDGWSYKLCPVGDETLLSADYGIHFFPADAKEEYIELGYHSFWGVCGTGLTTETKTLANDTASIGYYDGSDIWSFISYGGSNEGIHAINSSSGDWQQTYSEQAIDILDSLVYNPNEQTGAIGIYHSDSEIENLCLSVSAKDISATKATLEFNQYEDGITTELSFGEDFKIEKWDGNTWNEADIVVDGNYAFHDVAHIININDVTEYEYDWEWLYGSLTAGEYRIAVHIQSRNDSGDFENYTAYVHFILR